MRKAHVRHIEVKGRRYVQACQYSDRKAAPDSPERKFRVLESFGLQGQESDMRAELYVAAYNALLEVRSSYAYRQVPRELVNARQDFLQNALAVFGYILGARTVQEILG